MSYKPTKWLEHEEVNGRVLQQGSPLTAAKLNHMEDGIQTAHQKLDTCVFEDTTEHLGFVNPTLYALRTGNQQYTDEEFSKGMNGVMAYSYAKGPKGVTITRIPLADAPNASKHVLEIRHNGEPTKPHLGGFCQLMQSEANAVFVQMFRAKVPVGYTLYLAANSLGKGGTERWLTDNKGTGKWEMYARLTMCGVGGDFSTSGFVYLTGTPAPTAENNVVWHIASCTQFKLTDQNRQVDWMTPTLLNGWIAYGEGFAEPAYYKDANGRVHLMGLMKAGAKAQGTVLFGMPVGYRPKAQLLFAVSGFPAGSGMSCVRVDVSKDGLVKINQNVENYHLSLNGISFLAEQ